MRLLGALFRGRFVDSSRSGARPHASYTLGTLRIVSSAHFRRFLTMFFSDDYSSAVGEGRSAHEILEDSGAVAEQLLFPTAASGQGLSPSCRSSRRACQVREMFDHGPPAIESELFLCYFILFYFILFLLFFRCNVLVHVTTMVDESFTISCVRSRGPKTGEENAAVRKFVKICVF